VLPLIICCRSVDSATNRYRGTQHYTMEENKTIVRPYIEEAFNHGDLGIFDELI
jgi:hypothetical protein